MTDAKELSIVEYVNAANVKSNIEQTLQDRTPQFITSVISLVNSNEALKSADKKSVLGACLTAAALDLPINQNLGFAYIIPYKDNKKGITIAQFQMGYRGYIQLAMRSGQFKTINATDVREGEIKGVDRLSGDINLVWYSEDKEREEHKIVGYIAYFKLLNGFEKTLYMTQAELEKHGKRFSQSMKKGFGMWVDDFDAMSKKTVLKLLLSKFAPMTTKMETALLADQAVIEDGNMRYLDNMKDAPEVVSRLKEEKRIADFIAEAKTIEELGQCAEAVKGSQSSALTEAYEAKVNELTKE